VLSPRLDGVTLPSARPVPLVGFGGRAARRSIGLALYAGALVAIVGGRGFTLTRLMGGRYPLSYLVFDVVAFGVVIAGLRLFDRLVLAGAQRLIGEGSRGRRVAARALHVVILLLVVFPFILVTLQLHPLRIMTAGTPGAVGLAYAEVRFAADGRWLAGWHIPAGRAEGPVVLIAHGFNANKENFLLPAVLVHQLGYDVVMFDFRAHGDSDGHTSTFGLAEARDVKAAHDWIRQSLPDRPVYALAYSMGGAAVVHAAAEYGLFDRMVLDSSFASLETVARGTLLRPFGPLATPLWTLGRAWAWVWAGVDLDTHRPGERIGALAGRPLLLIHGTGDRLVPHAETLRLYEATGHRADLWLVPGAGHVQAVDQPEYRERLRRFFAGAKPPAG
jgi:pimeloyl-ACP methyl ester carboxylesterase